MFQDKQRTIEEQKLLQRQEGELNKSRQGSLLQDAQQEQLSLQQNVQRNMPPIAGGNIDPADDQQQEPVSMYRNKSIFQLSDDFGEINKQDSAKMQAVKNAFNKYRETAGMYGAGASQTDLDNLNELISACRWYNASRWSLRSRARERRAQVASILKDAKKERDRILREFERREKLNKEAIKEKEAEAKVNLEKTEKSGFSVSYIHNSSDTGSGSKYFVSSVANKWAAFKACTFGFIGRNILNLAMGAVAGAAWVATYPIAAAYAKISGKSKFKKGFNIKIPRPMSPLGWYNYYRNEQGHATGEVKRVQDRDAGFFRQIGTFIGRSIQYNLWDPFKSIVTLDINSLAGGGVIEPHAKEKEIDKQQRIDAEMRSIRENIGDNED